MGPGLLPPLRVMGPGLLPPLTLRGHVTLRGQVSSFRKDARGIISPINVMGPYLYGTLLRNVTGPGLQFLTLQAGSPVSGKVAGPGLQFPGEDAGGITSPTATTAGASKVSRVRSFRR